MASQKKTSKHDKPGSAAVSKRKRIKLEMGQLAAVPLLDGTYALIHVAQCKIGMIAAHYAHRAKRTEQLLEGLTEAMANGPIAMLKVTGDEVRDGLWPVIGYKDPMYPAEMLDMKGVSHLAATSRFLFNAYYGLRPWDEAVIPGWYDRMLLPGIPVPPTVRYKRDFEKDAAAAARLAAPPPPPTIEETAAPPVTDGPAVIHIEIRYPGEDLPSVELLHRRQALERTLEEAGAGTVTDAGGGGGVMDIYLRTADVRRAMPLVVNAAREAHFDNDSKIETSALSAPEDD